MGDILYARLDGPAVGPAFEVFARDASISKLSGEEVTVSELMVLARQVVARRAMRQLLGDDSLTALDGASLFYLTWRWAYLTADVPADEAYKLERAFDIDMGELTGQGGLVEPDERQLTLGILNLDQHMGRDTSADVLRHAEQVLHNRGSIARTNKNTAMLVAADDAALRKARASARTLAALRDVKADPPRLSRFNKEQRDQLDERLATAEERVPQHVAMAFRHLLLFSERNGKLRLKTVDLGPAKADARIGDRVLDHLRAADRLVDTTSAPAALLADRLRLFRDDHPAIELDELAAAFARYPRLPKLATLDVLRDALVSGTQQGLFGLVSGSAWDADDTVVRFREPVAPDEVQFQPGTHVVRAAAAQALAAVFRRSDAALSRVSSPTAS